MYDCNDRTTSYRQVHGTDGRNHDSRKTRANPCKVNRCKKSPHKPFRVNRSKNTGVGGCPMQFDQLTLRQFVSSTVLSLPFNTLTSSVQHASLSLYAATHTNRAGCKFNSCHTYRNTRGGGATLFIRSTFNLSTFNVFVLLGIAPASHWRAVPVYHPQYDSSELLRPQTESATLARLVGGLLVEN